MREQDPVKYVNYEEAVFLALQDLRKQVFGRMCLSVFCLSVCLSARLSVCPSVCLLSVCLSARLSICHHCQVVWLFFSDLSSILMTIAAGPSPAI